MLPIAPGVEVAERDQLSYAQRRMWFLWQLDPQGAAYNLPMAVRLNGPLDLAALQHAFDALVARHETLRTRFVADGDDVRQQVDASAAPLQLHQDALAGLDEGARQAAIETIAEAEALAPSTWPAARCCGCACCNWRHRSTSCCSPCTTSSPTAGR